MAANQELAAKVKVNFTSLEDRSGRPRKTTSRNKNLKQTVFRSFSSSCQEVAILKSKARKLM